jgi:hypothetical protein
MAKKKNTIQYSILDEDFSGEILAKAEHENMHPLVKSILFELDKTEKKIQRLAIEEDPAQPNRFGGLYFDKLVLLPDRILKGITLTSSLVAAIINVRANQSSPFGRILENRFAYGFRVEPNHSSGYDQLSAEKQQELKKRAQEATVKLFNCGTQVNWDNDKLMTLPTFLSLSARNAVTFGRFATEIIYTEDLTGNKKFHSFRPVDAGTIYKAIPSSNGLDAVRQEGLRLLAELKNENLDPKKFEEDEYAWVQVVDGTARQAFTSDQLIVHNCYPVTNIEFNGYPLTPIDTAVAEITTHINITNLNKLYFQNGRASKGMVVIHSDDIDISTLQDMKQQFTQNINSVTHAFKTPILKVGKDDKLEWTAMDASSRDMEFQVLADSNCRIIMAAFQISPDEVPGYAHLSSNSNSNSMTQSSGEYKLELAKDAGLRPLLANLQDFLNSRILPLVDPEVSKFYSVRFHGLDADDEEKENLRLQEEMATHATYDDIRSHVEKPLLGKEWGGDFPLNPQVQAILDRYLTVGQILEHFFGIKDAAKDESLNYRRDNFWFQQVMLLQQLQQAEEQQKLAEQQLEEQKKQTGTAQPEQNDELVSGVDQLISTLSKKAPEIKSLKPKLMAQHDAIIKAIFDDWELKSKELIASISTDLAKKHKK